MRQACSFLLMGWTVMMTGGPVLSGCSGAEFGVIDFPGGDHDGATDTQVPTNDRNTSVGGNGGTGAAGSGGTGAGGRGGTGNGGAGGNGGSSGADSGIDDGPDDDGTGGSDAPSDNRAADRNDGPADSLDSRGGADSERSGDVADGPTGDTPTDAPTGDAKDASDVRSDSSIDSDARDSSTDFACSEPVVYYRDEDGDGFGNNNQAITACVAPDNQWSPRGGDCRDDLPGVKPFLIGWPNPPQYSGSGYADSNKPQGISFDYDCTGTETADPGNAYGPDPNCGGLLDCKGAGYLPLNPARTGPGIDPRCGSTTLSRCNGNILNCFALQEVTTIPYRCR